MQYTIKKDVPTVKSGLDISEILQDLIKNTTKVKIYT